MFTEHLLCARHHDALFKHLALMSIRSRQKTSNSHPHLFISDLVSKSLEWLEDTERWKEHHSHPYHGKMLDKLQINDFS